MSQGTQITDMTDALTDFPDGAFVPFVVEETIGSLVTTINYRYNAGLYLAKYSTLAANGGAALIGTSESITVQAALTARPTSATLAADGGAALIGEAGGGTVQDAIDATGYMGALGTTAGLQAAIDVVAANGGTLLIPPQALALTSQVTLTPTTWNNIHIIAYGVEITTTGAISGLKIASAINTPAQIVIEGLMVNHRGNATATAGFELVRADNVTLRNCTVEAHGTGASYAACLLKQSDTADENTGCLWATLDNFTVRPRSGGDGSITYGVRSIGYNNALRILGGAITATTGVSLTTAGTAELVANAVVIDGVAFEGGTTAISVVGKTGATASISGLRVINCRAEALTTFLSLTGSTLQPVVPPFLAGNYLTPDVTYIANTNSLYTYSLDASTNAVNAPEMDIGGTGRVRNVSGSGSTWDLWASATNTAVGRWLDNAGNVVGTYRWDTGGEATLLASGAASLNLAGIRSLSQTTTPAENLRGTATLSSGSAAISFGTAEPDTSYFIMLGGNANETFRWGSKATSGFTITSSNGSSTATVDWLLVR